jgi:hypothetical protein
VINAANVSDVTIAADRAGVTCAAKLQITSDGPLHVTMVGCHLPLSRPGCPAAAGRLAGMRLGSIRLGMTRAQARQAYRQSSDRGRRYEDFFCLAPTGIRVGYASAKLLRTLRGAERARYRNRVVWVSTANRRYSVRGVAPGASLSIAKQRLHLGRGFKVGANTWYFGPNGSSMLLLKVRHGIVEEIGIAIRRLTSSPARQRRFVHSFS